MIKKFVFAAMISLFIILPFISAAFDTPIKIKSLADHKASIFIYKSGNLDILESYHLNTQRGEISITYSSPESRIDVRVKITKDSQKVFNEFFEGYEAGKPINIKIDYSGVDRNYAESAAKETLNKTETIEENKTETTEENATATPAPITESPANATENNSAPITGAAIDNAKNSFSNVIYFIIGGILIAALIVLFIVRASMRSSNKANSSIPASAEPSQPRKPASPIKQNYTKQSSSFKPSSYSSALRQSQQPQRQFSNWQSQQQPQNRVPSIISGNNEDIEIDDEYIRQLESKIKEAERELNFIKNVEKIKAAEKRLEEDRRELERLKGGE